MVFNKKKSNEVALLETTTVEMVNGKLDTIIGQGASVNGIIKTEGPLRIDGKVEGEINISGDLFIGKSGVVTASVTAKNVSLAGVVKGNIKVDGKLELLASGQLYGDVDVHDLSVAQGAILQGKVSMNGTAHQPQ